MKSKWSVKFNCFLKRRRHFSTTANITTLFNRYIDINNVQSWNLIIAELAATNSKPSKAYKFRNFDRSNVYCKCGRFNLARRAFDRMKEKNVKTWSAMIAGYGMHGQAKEAIEILSEMIQHGIKPDSISFELVAMRDSWMKDDTGFLQCNIGLKSNQPRMHG